MKSKLFLSILLVFSNIALASTKRVINVFFDGRTGELAVNTELNSGRSGFIRTNKIVLVSNEFSICEAGCLASIQAKDYSTFAIVVAGQEVALVTTNDSDNLLPSKAFQTTEKFGKEKLVLNLDLLKKDSRAEVK